MLPRQVGCLQKIQKLNLDEPCNRCQGQQKRASIATFTMKRLNKENVRLLLTERVVLIYEQCAQIEIAAFILPAKLSHNSILSDRAEGGKRYLGR